MTRVLTALVALPLLLFATWWSSPYLFVGIAAIALLAALHEFYEIADRAGAPPFRIVGFVASAVILGVAAGVGPEWNALVLAATTIVVMMATLGRHPRVRMTAPTGAFYGFPRVEGLSDGLAFARLVLRQKVGIAPGYTFGPGNETHFRLCFARGPEQLGEALERICKVLDRLD